jgi:hypothetical protein
MRPRCDTPMKLMIRLWLGELISPTSPVTVLLMRAARSICGICAFKYTHEPRILPSAATLVIRRALLTPSSEELNCQMICYNILFT